MKSYAKTSTFILLLLLGFVFKSNAQSIKLIGFDTVNGAATGTALGAATMALQDSKDSAPLRVGLGLGILYGIGTGIYDNSIISGGEQFYISGTFNDGKNSTILVLLDTVYGAAGGAAVGGAIALVANDPILDGFQYGSGAGAWLGFGFGLIDAFVLAETPNDLQASAKQSNHAGGIVQIHPSASENVSIGLINPTVISHKTLDTNSIKMSNSMAMEFVNMKVTF